MNTEYTKLKTLDLGYVNITFLTTVTLMYREL
jgi:hypothetical protein